MIRWLKTLHFLTPLALAALAVCICGCEGSAPTYPAGGKVTYPDGTPLAGGRVEFISLDADPPVNASGVVRDDGTYELGTHDPGDGAIAGRHGAIVRPSNNIPRPGEPPKKVQEIDIRFRRYDTSGLTFTVTEDPEKNRFDITVEPSSF